MIPPMRAAILAVGTELLGTDRLDTNSLRLTEVLERHGVELVAKAVVGDAEEAIAEEVRRFTAQADLLLVSGGLGPTADDVTRPAVALALGRDLDHDPAVLAGIAARFRRYGLRMPEVNRRQAEVIAGATLLANPRGTAPGMRLDLPGGGAVFLFPGVPTELAAMVDADLEPWLATRSAGHGRERAVLKVASLAESTVEERILPAYAEFGREAISVLARPGEILLQFWASGPAEARRRRLAAIAARLRELVGPAVFTDRLDEDLAAVVGEALRRRGETLATAESCTGGWLGQRLTAVPGSSEVYLGGVVAYADRVKEDLLGVPVAVLAAHGAVSEPVARAMALGARRRFGADHALAVTGIAGPGGGSAGKPVGTVHLALAVPGGGEGEVLHRRVRFPGDRERVRWMATQLALEMLRRHLLGSGGEAGEAGGDAREAVGEVAGGGERAAPGTGG
jgi:nicotinamide-nucleotide amidase